VTIRMVNIEVKVEVEHFIIRF